MRRKNWRLVIAGSVLIALALLFYVVMLSMAPKSNDPRTLMSTVGTVSGVVIGLSVAMIVIGLIGRRIDAEEP